MSDGTALRSERSIARRVGRQRRDAGMPRDDQPAEPSILEGNEGPHVGLKAWRLRQTRKRQGLGRGPFGFSMRPSSVQDLGERGI